MPAPPGYPSCALARPDPCSKRVEVVGRSEKSRSGGTGRRGGLKIRFPKRECGFNSHLRHNESAGIRAIRRHVTRERLKALLAEYGSVALYTYLGLFVVVLAGFAVAIAAGVEVESAQ